jgi:catechol 2,3-dioxygenase-like lactoylglutathione lyase family enzyme
VSLVVSDIKPFIGAKDYELSRDFYVALGWHLNFEVPELAELQLGEHRFYLQPYFQKDWCENTMLHLTVADARGWYERAGEVLASRDFGPARVREPARQDYGALVTFVWDPSGVLLHFAQPLEPAT